MNRKLNPIIKCLAALSVFVTFVVSGPTEASATAANEKYVKSLYYDLLLRAPDSNELLWYTTILDNGNPRTTVTNGIVGSDEFKTLWFYYIRQQYLVDFEFDDPTNGPMLSSLISSGNYVATEISTLSSSAYFSTSGGTNTSYVTALYRDVLATESSAIAPGDLSYWVNRLDNATNTPAQVASLFVRSSQSAGLRVKGLPAATSCPALNLGDDLARWAGSFCLILDRMSDPSGASYWTGQLTASGQLPTMWASLAASNEYYNLSQA